METTVIKTLLIDSTNEKEFQEVKEVVEKLINIQESIVQMQEFEIQQRHKLETLGYKTIGLLDKNIRITITPSTGKQTIDYDKTLEGLDKSEYQIKKTITKTEGNNDKIINELKEVSYIGEQTTPRILVSKLNKEVNNG